jgi:DNA-directed RNA polymerase sigma subunit (sigma70/sigma32)
MCQSDTLPLKLPPHGTSRSSHATAASERDALEWEVNADPRVYLSEIGRESMLSEEAEWRLGWNIATEGCAVSVERLVRANLRLVVGIVPGYMGRGLALADLINCGNHGLLHAAIGFNPERDPRFSTYANWWIKHSIRQGLTAARAPVIARIGDTCRTV